ncbi:hypothetical protein AKJ09_05500 [Labilithrix luteola]|uniref:Uncharacterized protein n=1 Tax=Labilithrix luteola TaxID=1391654 RepID=A0A0K1PZM9_9BACT|nr:hypothetical protein AKJ09_05500 [Labilithrix luteola]
MDFTVDCVAPRPIAVAAGAGSESPSVVRSGWCDCEVGIVFDSNLDGLESAE